jgi:hypothetical protein
MEEDIKVPNSRGILMSSLRKVRKKKSSFHLFFFHYSENFFNCFSFFKVLEQLHPSLTAKDEALYYVENLCLRLLANLCTGIHTIAVRGCHLLLF